MATAHADDGMLDRLRASRANLLPDLMAGVTGAFSYIPQGMAYALVAGVSPIYGLYTGVFAPVIGGLLAGSSFIVITVTNELAMPTGGILVAFGPESAARALFTLTLLIGIIQLAFGLLKFGKITRFISHSVTTGFIAGVGVLLVLGQLQKLTGYKGQVPGNIFVRTWNWLLHLNQGDWRTTLVGVFTLGVIILLQRTRLKAVALVVALLAATLGVFLLHWDSVALVGALSRIPRGLPSFLVPDIRLIPQLFIPALSLAVLGLSVAAGVSQNYPELDGTMPDASRDFVAQGAANLIGGFFQGMPAGGSISRTATSVSAGAKSRWANIFAGLVLGIVLLMFAGFAELVPMAALAGLLISIGIGVLSPDRIAKVWNTHVAERVAMAITFVLTLIIPLHWAIFAGVGLTLLVYIYSSSTKVRLVQIVHSGDGDFQEIAAPAQLPSHSVVALHAYGNAFFAAVYTLEAALPAPENTDNSVVIFGLRGRESITSSAVAMLERYIRRLQARGNKLMLFGIEPPVRHTLERTGLVQAIGEDCVFAASAKIGGSFQEAWGAAHEIVRKKAQQA
jgi:SulP family sulfate permease